MSQFEEPWEYQEKSDAYTHIIRAVSSPGMIVLSGRQDSSGKTESFVRRAVACVNACAGIENPEEDIAALRSYYKTVSHDNQKHNELRRQRDELIDIAVNERKWRLEDSECGGPEIQDSCDKFKSELLAKIKVTP